MSTSALYWERRNNPVWYITGLALRPLHLALAFPSIIYLATLTIFLFRPPDLFCLYVDRVAFGILVFVVGLRTFALHEKLPFYFRISFPMLGLIMLAAFRALREPFDAQVWSIIASKFIVPFVLFHLASRIFRTSRERSHFETFVVVVLAYLVFIAIAFLVGARSLIVPRFILDESLGFHPERARGPFLQAVANGVSLNLLGILAFALPFRRKIANILWLALPVAILATMTRAIWISFGLSTLALGFRLSERRLRAICVALLVVGLLAGLAIGFSDHSLKNALWDRTEERGPVEARMAVYSAGWDMFLERPFTGWPAGMMYSELARRMDGYHLRTFYVHNTYLALLVEFGLPGLILYLYLFRQLFRIGSARTDDPDSMRILRRAWPILLSVYLFNAFFVDMAYQFVIGLLFTVAGMLCAPKAEA